MKLPSLSQPVLAAADTASAVQAARRRSVVALSILVLTALLVPGSATAYKVFLKDGTTISAQEEYVVQGELALVTLESGSLTRVDLAEIDVEKTRDYNSRPGYSGAIVISEDGRGESATMSGDGNKTLRDLIRSRRGHFGERQNGAPSASSQLRRTPAGYEDLATMIRRPLEDRDLSTEVNRVLRDQGISRSTVYSGSQPDRLLIELVTESEGAVLDSLQASCRAFLEIRQRYPSIVALEVLMQTSARLRAGQFVLNSENAPLLANERMTATDFFVEHVQF